ncbi:hypothetical protein JR316_0006464 [Psilocybe cubensis]|uniref:Uncharacterized protein n=1 Tax=Psilocybe cubensis TaxID=181762 RepID=A0ACB8H2K8_PSICU|nr:hypothetical protein JR316_0006464 [Psilocybe cubensis]KAH9481934.1 hypothetical protein JR316_0006464 [Psilocybe cubensis]
MSTIINISSIATATVLQSMHTVDSEFRRSGRTISLMLIGKKTGIDDLPDELIREIMFTIMEPSTRSEKVDDKLSIISPIVSENNPITPFPLTRVCRRWRRIACTTKSLWKSIAIIEPSFKHVHRVKLWLTYGDGYKLDIMLRQSYSVGDEERRATAEILTMLVQRIQKWSNVEFHFTENELPSLIAHHMRHPNPSVLQTAIISHQSRHMDIKERARDVWGSLQETPLKHLKWISPAPAMAFSSANIQTLNTSCFTFQVLLDTLRLCPNLSSIDVELLNVPPMDADHLEYRVEYPNLRSVAMKGHKTDIATFLRLHCLPSLTSLELDPIDVTSFIHLRGLILRSECTLRQLALEVRNVQALDVAGWLEQDFFQELETLSISGAEINDHVLLMLTCPPLRGNRPTYFEKLKFLFLGQLMSNVDDGTFLRMLGSRFWTPQGAPPKTELEKAGFLVATKTNPMAMYEVMINSCAERMAESKDKNWRHWQNPFY